MRTGAGGRYKCGNISRFASARQWLPWKTWTRASAVRPPQCSQPGSHPSISLVYIFIFGCRRRVMFVLPFSLRIHSPGKYSLIMRVSTHVISNGILVSENNSCCETCPYNTISVFSIYCSCTDKSP